MAAGQRQTEEAAGQRRAEVAAVPTAPTAPTTAGRPPRGRTQGDGPDDNNPRSSDSSGWESSRSDARRHRRHRHRRRHAATGPRRRHRRKNTKGLELTSYKPSPTVSVSTWIAKVELAVEGARGSWRGNWTDEELYFVVGNKLQDKAAGWWVKWTRRCPT
ncbi:hypothetical protein PR003_g558 [Phytophthora rubi]|uniref:Uncharacterized protein n=1 Tax=Phytophthora rubi TaxID=129364 RepID=A0A6A4G621_9STRA|nr:hypothetical protein PR003_g558 [Phytophthora rubi]